MFIFLLFFLTSSKIFDIPASQVASFTQQHSEKFLVLYFCDFSMDPCVFFTNTTNPFFKRIQGKVAKINVSSKEEASHLQEYDIKDFPYIIYIKPGAKHQPYKGSLEPIEIFTTLDRIQKGLIHYSKVETVYTDLDADLYSDGLVLAFGQKSFEKIAEKLLPFFPLATADFGLEELGCGKACIVVFRPNILQPKGKPSFSVINGQGSENAIVEEYYKGLVWLTPNNHIWLDKEKPLLTLYGKISGKSEPSNTKYVINRYLAVVKEYFEDFTVAIAKIDDFQWILADIGLGKHRSLIMFDNTEDMFYEFDVIGANYSVNSEKIQKFISDYEAGVLKPYIVSEPVPEKEFENDVKVLVGSTVKQEIAELERDAVLLVYSIFNEELEELIYFFEQMASHLKELKFMKLEAHKNYVPASMVMEYPAMFYIKPGYEPQHIKIDLEDPEKTLKIIAKYYRSSHDL